MSSLDPRLDPHQHAKSLLSVDVPASFILISSLEHIAPETPRAPNLLPTASLNISFFGGADVGCNLAQSLRTKMPAPF